MNFKFEYILFIIIVIYYTLKELLKLKKKKDSNNKNSISIHDSDIKEINGTYIPEDNFYNEALVYKNEKYDYWIYKVIEKVSKNEENCFWVLSKDNPKNLEKTSYSDKNVIYHSINIVDIGDFYVYQYIDFGNYISNDNLTMSDKNDSNKKIKILIL